MEKKAKRASRNNFGRKMNPGYYQKTFSLHSQFSYQHEAKISLIDEFSKTIKEIHLNINTLLSKYFCLRRISHVLEIKASGFGREKNL